VADWHLRELEDRLAKRGWKILSVHDGDGYRVSASWEIGRGDRRLFLDFQGFDDMAVLPLERAYAVDVRGHPSCDLYFGKRPTEARPNRSWEEDVTAFVAALDGLAP
jgi:hypothetical protein